MDPNSLNLIKGAAGAGGPYSGDIAVGHYVSPYISVYPWTSGTGFGTKYSDPSTLPAGTGRNIDFTA